jgi:hypothetical protein
MPVSLSAEMDVMGIRSLQLSSWLIPVQAGHGDRMA